MKLLRFGELGNEKPGILDSENNIRDLTGEVVDISGDDLSNEALSRLRKLNPNDLPIVQGTPRIGTCVGNIGKLVCVGLNYTDHAAELNMDLPDEPVVFMKAPSCICGPNDHVELPPGSTKTDWEVELGIVIGKHTKNISEENALDHVAGYCAVNDISERDFQLEHCGQWTKGKSYDTFGPIGPWLVTRDEIPDPHNLEMYLEVNGHRHQNGSTKTMQFKVPMMVAHLSRFMSLQPGDVISTGTPPGVGGGQTPQAFLKAGDSMELGIEGLGVQLKAVVQG